MWDMGCGVNLRVFGVCGVDCGCGVRSWVLLQAGSMPGLRLQQRLLPHL